MGGLLGIQRYACDEGLNVAVIYVDVVARDIDANARDVDQSAADIDDVVVVAFLLSDGDDLVADDTVVVVALARAAAVVATVGLCQQVRCTLQATTHVLSAIYIA